VLDGFLIIEVTGIYWLDGLTTTGAIVFQFKVDSEGVTPGTSGMLRNAAPFNLFAASFIALITPCDCSETKTRDFSDSNVNRAFDLSKDVCCGEDVTKLTRVVPVGPTPVVVVVVSVAPFEVDVTIETPFVVGSACVLCTKV